MILVDTSIWIDHFRSGDAQLVTLLQDDQVLGHPRVTGELALGNLARRNEVLGLLHNLPQATVATDLEVMTLIDHHRLLGLGIGYVDAHLPASASRLAPNYGRVTSDSMRQPCNSNSNSTLATPRALTMPEPSYRDRHAPRDDPIWRRPAAIGVTPVGELAERR